jgi:hypothetical protein
VETATETKKSNGRPASTALLDVEVECIGITPLLLNRMSEATLLGIREKRKKPKSAGPAGTPREECEPKLYKTNDGVLYLPAEMAMACLITAGQFIRLDGKRQVSTAKSTLLPAFLSLHDPFIPLDAPDGWQVDIRPGRNPNGGEAVCLCRPRFDRWGFTLHVQIDTAEIQESVIRELFDIAGRRCGLGDFRQNRRGIFGQFKVQKWA